MKKNYFKKRLKLGKEGEQKKRFIRKQNNRSKKKLIRARWTGSGASSVS